MSDEQPKKRHRRKSVARQLQEALIAARELDTAEANELTITKSKLVQTRLVVLAKMQALERFDKIRKLKEEVDGLRVENERLKVELAQALAGVEHRMTGAVATEINEALAKYQGCEAQGGKDASHV